MQILLSKHYSKYYKLHRTIIIHSPIMLFFLYFLSWFTASLFSLIRILRIIFKSLVLYLSLYPSLVNETSQLCLDGFHIFPSGSELHCLLVRLFQQFTVRFTCHISLPIIHITTSYLPNRSICSHQPIFLLFTWLKNLFPTAVCNRMKLKEL